MTISKKAKPSKKVQAKAAAAKPRKTVAKKKAVSRVAKVVAKKVVRRKKPVASKSSGFSFDFKALRKKFKALQSYWALGMIGGALVVTSGLIYAQRGVELPTPLESQVPLGVTQAQPEPQREVAQAPVVVAPSPSPSPVAVEDNGALTEDFAAVKSRELPDRIAYWSEFLTKADALAKLQSVQDPPRIEDTAPLLPSKFDCTTFVETVAALTRSAGAKDFYGQLISIRYRDGKPDYFNRNHFPEIDWIPNNAKAGILKDVTWDISEASGVSRQAERKVINRGQWLAKQVRKGKASRDLASIPETGNVEAVVPYLAVKDLAQVESNIPDGAVLNIVRKNKDGTPVLITHQGFVILKEGKAWIRHASVGGNIRTLILSDYLRELSKKASDKDWPVIGINLNKIL